MVKSTKKMIGSRSASPLTYNYLLNRLTPRLRKTQADDANEKEEVPIQQRPLTILRRSEG